MRHDTIRMYLAALALAATAGCQPTAQPPAQTPANTPMVALSLAANGDGTGRVVSDPAGIQCPSAACSAQFPLGTTVELSATAEPGFQFDSWSLSSCGTNPKCTVTMTAAQQLSFSFKSIPQPPSCTAPQVQCGTSCVDTDSDVNNCGGCNLACASGESCVAAVCTPLPPSCAAPNLLCGAQCVDIGSDAGNCGACGNACTGDQSCVSATCVGTGSLQISASWSRAGDGDLIVTTPTGNTIWWNNRGPDASTDFAVMDRDDTAGVGPENIFWQLGTAPASGTYFICFELGQFSPAPSDADPLSATITVQLPGSQRFTNQVMYTAGTSRNGACDPSMDTFITGVNYP